jgi:putative transposase
MELTKTLILKISNPDSDLVNTMERYAEGMNYVSKFVYGKGRPIGAMKLQSMTYVHLREVLLLKSQISCNIPRQVAGAYKTLTEQIKIGMTEWQLLVFRPTSMTLSYKRDFGFNGDIVGITTLNAGRKPYKIMEYDHAKEYMDGSWTYTASRVCRHRDGCYYLHLGLSKVVEEPSIEKASKFIGVDVGMNYLAVASTTDAKQAFFDGRRIKDIRNRYSGIRQRLQSKGTLSAKRMLKHLSGREKRLMRDVNHVVSKQVVAFAVKNNVSVIGLEDLTGIRDRTQYNVAKDNRYYHSSWAFRELQMFVEYKAKEAGILTMYIDGSYTSQTCPRCNHIAKKNRTGLTFRCEACGYELNADLNAARNIEHRTRDFRYTLESQGRLSAAQTDTPQGEIQAPPFRTG